MGGQHKLQTNFTISNPRAQSWQSWILSRIGQHGDDHTQKITLMQTNKQKKKEITAGEVREWEAGQEMRRTIMQASLGSQKSVSLAIM